MDALADYPVPLKPADVNLRAKEANIAAMRDRMINHFPGRFIAGFFLGGMEGVVDEFVRFGRHWPKAPRFPLKSTGGATAIGWPEPGDPALLAVIPTAHPRPFQAPLWQQANDDAHLQTFQRHLLEQIASEPPQITFRTFFRRLLAP